MWDYYELNHDGSTHRISQAQHESMEPFSAPPVSLNPVSSLLDKVLATAGACKPMRDAVDSRIQRLPSKSAAMSAIMCKLKAEELGYLGHTMALFYRQNVSFKAQTP
jgi:hypothetical protein